MKSIIKKNCRLCNSNRIIKLFNLCDSPLANNLALTKKESLNLKYFPLNLMFCMNCKHIQLQNVIKAEFLYSKYLYMTGVSKQFKNHFKDYSQKIIKEFQIKNKLKILEIGSNDCTLLDYFKKKNHTTIGVEPAKNLWALTNHKHQIYNSFYNEKINQKIKKKYKSVDLIIANNVFAHIDNLKNTFQSLKKILHNEGLITFEVSYLLDVIKFKLFDTIYHEHLDYHSIIPLDKFFKKINFKIINIEKIKTHGGSIRVTLAKKISKRTSNLKKINKLILKEKQNKLDQKSTFLKFFNNIEKEKNRLKLFFKNIQNENIYGYGAPAKAVTLVNYFGLGKTNFKFIIDDSNLKQNKYLPGTEIKIINSKILYSNKEDKVIFILAWNVYEDIMKKIKNYNNIKYAIVPFPKLKIFKL